MHASRGVWLYGFGHSGVLGGMFVSKPELSGLRSLEPDFMYITTDSANVTAVLIEIERPGKVHATKDGLPSKDLRQARAQVEDWRTWFSDPTNVIRFREEYGIRPGDLRSRGFQTRFVLVFGRRSDVESNTRFAKARARNQDVLEMTFDRLLPSGRYAGVPVARLDRTHSGETKFRIVAVSPMADELAFGDLDPTRVVGVEEALAAQPHLSPERRKFLLKRAKRRRR